MASRPIREVQGLNIVYKHINPDKSENGGLEPVKYFSIENKDDLDKASSNHPWILKEVCTMYLLFSWAKKKSCDPSMYVLVLSWVFYTFLLMNITIHGKVSWRAVDVLS